jgi:hypothetical protein
MDALQFTAVLEVFVMVAVNCALDPEFTFVLTGDTATLIGGETEMAALADFVESAALVAVSVAVLLVVTAGAVYKPLPDTVPLDAVQLTPVFVLLLTVA